MKIDAPPECVFGALVTDISSWWGPAHTFSDSARDVVLLEGQGEATVVRLSHRVAGEITEETRRSYSGGWQTLLGRGLKPFVERGERTGVKR